MIAVHLLSPEKVAEALKVEGCKRLGPLDDSHDIWQTAWGFTFTVPVIGDDRWCPKHVLHEILSDIEQQRPDDYAKSIH